MKNNNPINYFLIGAVALTLAGSGYAYSAIASGVSNNTQSETRVPEAAPAMSTTANVGTLTETAHGTTKQTEASASPAHRANTTEQATPSKLTNESTIDMSGSDDTDDDTDDSERYESHRGQTNTTETSDR